MKKCLAALALVALPIAVSAADLDYSFVDAAYSQADSDIRNGHLDFAGGQGWMLDGSYALGGHWYLEAAYRYNSFHLSFGTPFPPGSLTLSPESLRLGGGFHAALSDNVDFTAHADYGQARTTSSVTNPDFSVHETDDGYLLGMGLRIHPSDAAEVDLGLDHDDLGFGQRMLVTCATQHPLCTVAIPARQDGKENVVSAALRHDFGAVTGGVEYRRSSYQGWRELLVSLRMTF